MLKLHTKSIIFLFVTSFHNIISNHGSIMKNVTFHGVYNEEQSSFTCIRKSNNSFSYLLQNFLQFCKNSMQKSSQDDLFEMSSSFRTNKADKVGYGNIHWKFLGEFLSRNYQAIYSFTLFIRKENRMKMSEEPPVSRNGM